MKANTITAYETRLSQVLTAIDHAGLDSETVKENAGLYNALADAAQDFFGKVALSQVNRNKIDNGIDEEMTTVVDECTMHMIRKLDAVLEVPGNQRIPFLVQMANNRISDLERRDRAHLTKSRTMDDVEWGYVSDASDLEDDCAQADADACLFNAVLKSLCSDGKPLSVVSILSTSVLEKKPAALAQELIDKGFQAVLLETVTEVCGMFRMDTAMFSDVIRKGVHMDYDFSGMTAKAVSAKISNAIYNGKADTRKAVEREMDVSVLR